LFRNEEIETYLDRLHEVKNKEKTIFNYIQKDSGTEGTFATDCENDEKIKFYFKIPKGFKIPTPLGNYTPDWAVVFENDTKVYFVVETKSTLNENDLRVSESLKIKCGKEHFSIFEGVSYKQMTKVGDLY
jgi:type III restriction enzyme